MSIQPTPRAAELLGSGSVESGGLSWPVAPSPYADLVRGLTPRERWRYAYRAARMELKGMARRVIPRGEVGIIEGFTFITTP